MCGKHVESIRKLDPYGMLTEEEMQDRAAACDAFEEKARAGEIPAGYYASSWPLSCTRWRALTAEEYTRFVTGADYLHAVIVTHAVGELIAD